MQQASELSELSNSMDVVAHPLPGLPDLPGLPANPEDQTTDDLPTYIMRPEGVYYVPFFHIDRDQNIPVQISGDLWSKCKDIHGRFTAVGLLLNLTISASNIVVLSTCSSDATSNSTRIHWFVRIAVQGEHRRFTKNFGQNFLWQLPYGSCTKIIQELHRYAVKHNQAPSPLTQNGLMPTPHEFDASHQGWTGLKKCDRFLDYYDTTFAMMVFPATKAVPLHTEGPRLRSRAPRPARYHTSKNSSLDFSNGLPDDVIDVILKHSVGEWVKSPDKSDWKAMIALRTVNRAFRDQVNTSAAVFMKSLAKVTHTAQSSFLMTDVEAAQVLFRDSGISMMKFLVDCNEQNFLNLMRLHRGLPPDSKPPSRQEAAMYRAAQHASFLKASGNWKDSSTSWNPINDKRQGGFDSRREKRRRILLEAGVFERG